MSEETLPPDIQRFILRSIDSIPHLEAILLLRLDPKAEWDAAVLSQRLFINEKRAREILSDLSASGFLTAKKGDTLLYFYNPVSLELEKLMTDLNEIYAKNLIEVTNLIHSRVNKQAQQLGDAFKWQKEKE